MEEKKRWSLPKFTVEETLVVEMIQEGYTDSTVGGGDRHPRNLRSWMSKS